ncbi:hypothetical protein LDENG_00274090 [Lucifuga dentata]|nr:hypothetical protein LDENG_00274090 [Lucifuga dentata]
MAATRSSAGKQQLSSAAQGAVQMRIKSSQTCGDRLSQSKSLILQESDLTPKAVSTQNTTKTT